MRVSIALLALAATFASATPAPPISARQVEWHAVGKLYSSGGCNEQSLIFADPVWGDANVCHPLDRFGNQPPIISYEVTSVDAGCTVWLFSDLGCSSPAVQAGPNQCMQGSAPFEGAIVECPAV